MHYFSLLGCVFFFSVSIFSQTPFEIEKRDYIWLFGYGDSSYEGFGGSLLDFNYSPVDIFFEDREVDLNVTNASICDKEGNLLFFTNGIIAANALGDTLLNGYGLNPGEFANDFSDGYVLNQGALILPVSKSDSLFYIFHGIREYSTQELGGHVSSLNYSIIENFGSQERVSEKNIVIIEDTLALGEITAVRHANGRDWWILVPEFNSNKYYNCLFTPNGIEAVDTQIIGDTVQSGLAQAVFSSNGEWYARINLINGVFAEDRIDLYSFDRCNGELSNQISLIYHDTASAAGIAFSSNSEYLYVSSSNYVYQYDLNAGDIESSRVTIAEYDGFQSPFATRFFLAQLAPDDQIYINSSNSVNTLHVIREPNRLGIRANVDQHALQLPTLNRATLANNPYYGLGPLDGSYCDTLGLDNHPIAYFRHTESGLEATFTDYSKLAPTDWFWKFGDGQTSEEINPIHQYEEPGMYNVCLTVSNENNSHEFCDSVQVILTTTNEPLSPIDISIYPNPSRDYFFVSSEDRFPNQSQIIVYNLLGQEQIKKAVDPTQTRQLIDVSYLPKGVYVIQIVVDGKVIGSEKVLKQ